MPTLTALQGTYIKTKIAPSNELTPSDLVGVKITEKLFVSSIVADKWQHSKIQLINPIKTLNTQKSIQEGYIYTPHFTIQMNSKILKIPVKYRRQIDNSTQYHGSGYRQCNLTSNAMLLSTLLGDNYFESMARSNGYEQAEDYYGEILARFGDTTDHGANTRALKEFGIESYFSYTISAEDILLSLTKNIPVVIGVSYKRSGHMILLTGYDYDKQNWLCHDPYGVRMGISDVYDTNLSGAYDTLTPAFMDSKFFDQGYSAGWSRMVTSVRGTPTSIPPGL